MRRPRHPRRLHEFDDTKSTVTSQFVGTTSPFTLSAVGADCDRFQCLLGLTAHPWKATDLDVTFDAEMASYRQSQASIVRLIHRF